MSPLSRLMRGFRNKTNFDPLLGRSMRVRHRMTRMVRPNFAVMQTQAVRETGETWVESEKNVEKKWLVQ